MQAWRGEVKNISGDFRKVESYNHLTTAVTKSLLNSKKIYQSQEWSW